MAGRLISDKGGWPANSDQSMKSKNRLKEYQSAEGMGGIKDYPDNAEDVLRDQKMGVAQIRKQPMKSGHRN